MKRNYFNIMSCIAIAIVTFFFYSCVIIDKMMIKGNYGREDRDFHAKSDISKKRTIIHDTYAAITSFMLCELYKNLHGLIDNVHQLQKSLYVAHPTNA